MAELPVQSLCVRLWGSGWSRGGAEGFRKGSAAGRVGALGAPYIEAAVAGLGAGSGKRRRGWKMPVHSRGDKKETNHHDEMEVDYAENEGSSSEDEDTESSSVSEDGDSSGVQPCGAGTESSCQASDRPLSARRAAASSWESWAGRGERGGDWIWGLGSTRTVAGRSLAPGGSLLAGRDGAGCVHELA